MRKPQVRPPRAPRGEDPHVTIGNLQNHVALLTKRCEDLVKHRDEVLAKNDRLATGLENLDQQHQSALENLNKLRGYQERVREEDRNRYGDLK